MSGGYIYLLGSDTGTLYIGVTSNLYLRVMQDKGGALEAFTAAYGCKRLLYFEGYEDSRTIRDYQVRTSRSCSWASVVEKLRAA
jgi:predicted GIY-YIG superfamily endonuclease